MEGFEEGTGADRFRKDQGRRVTVQSREELEGFCQNPSE